MTQFPQFIFKTIVTNGLAIENPIHLYLYGTYGMEKELTLVSSLHILSWARCTGI